LYENKKGPGDFLTLTNLAGNFSGRLLLTSPRDLLQFTGILFRERGWGRPKKNKKNFVNLVDIVCILLYSFLQMRDMNNWKEFFNEVAAACNYWELGFGDLCAEQETEIVRQCFVDGDDVDTACDAWRDFVMEHMYEKAL
tara:strand:- start:805 stop:1224 length:420 start_codon:yes stop_codon:yes gene_type:complete